MCTAEGVIVTNSCLNTTHAHLYIIEIVSSVCIHIRINMCHYFLQIAT